MNYPCLWLDTSAASNWLFDSHRQVASGSVDLIVHLSQGGRGWISWSENISCSHIFQYLCWIRLCIDSVSSRGYVVWCCFKNNDTQDLLSFLTVSRKPSFAQLIFNLSTVSIPVCLFQIDAGTMLYRGDCDDHLQTRVLSASHISRPL